MRHNDLIAYTSNTAVTTFLTILSTLFSASLLFGAIIILYNVKSDKLKLGLIALFTIIFSTIVGIVTNAKRVELFATTAAYEFLHWNFAIFNN